MKYDALNPGGYISYVVADGQSVTGDGVSVPLESHTKYDQSISSGYEVQNSDNDKVFDDTLGDIILTLTSITQLPFSFTVINTVGNTIMIPYDGYTFYVGNVIAVGNHLSCNTVGSSAKVRIHTTGKVMIETSGYWREAS